MPLFKHFAAIVIISAACLVSGCNDSGSKAPDVSNIKVDLKTYRFDQDFTSIDTNHMGQGLQQLAAKYPDFLNYFLDTFMTFGIHSNFSDTNPLLDSIKPLITFKDFAALQQTINETYPNTKAIDAELTGGFKYMKYYFPNYHVPRIIYMSMYLSKWSAFPLDSTTICVGLDWFLGDDFPHYEDLGVPPYMVAHQRPSYIPVSVFNAVYQGAVATHPYDNTLLDLMIQHGKEQYFFHKILPNTPDSVLFGYAQHKVEWCNSNEAVIYNFFVHEGLLYNKEPQSIMPYVNDGPFAVNFPDSDPQKNTPGNIGTWLGYRIVSAYMTQNPQVTLPQLLQQHHNAAQFLDAAKYRPK